MGGSAAAPQPPTLGPNETLYVGYSAWSADGVYELTFLANGTLVVFRRQNGTVAWASGTSSSNGGYARMQRDGNLVVVNGNGQALWTSHTNGHDDAYLLIANDEMVIYAADGTTRLWAVSLLPPASAAGAPGPGEPRARPVVVALLSAVCLAGLVGMRRRSGREGRARWGRTRGRRVLRTTLWVGVLLALAQPAWGQQAASTPVPDVTVCGRALEGTVRLATKSAVQQSRLLVELLADPELSVLERIPTDRTGRFRMPGGVPRRGRVWLLRVTGPGKQTTLVQFTIDPACKAPVITVKPGQGP